MKEITLKEWSAYLPYGLKFKTKRGLDTLSTLSDELINCDFEEWYSLNKVKPILYDLSWLTREITHEGESDEKSKVIENSECADRLSDVQELLKGIHDPNAQLQADKAELLEALEIFIEQNTPTFTSHDYEFPEHVMKAKSLIQKHKQ